MGFLQHQHPLEKTEEWGKYQVWVRNKQKKIQVWFVPTVSGLSSYFLSIIWSSSCSEWCIALHMWIYRQRSVGMCGSACVGQRAMVYLQQICGFVRFKWPVVHPCGTLRSAASVGLRTQLQHWASWMAIHGQRLVADVCCWSHAFLSKAI